MNKLRLIIIFFIFTIIFPVFSQNYAFKNETLNYTVTYKWGLIHKDSGKATLKLTKKGDKYHIVLSGRTDPWADKFFTLRDTLISNINAFDFRPLNYTKIAHEGGKYSKDDIKYVYNGNQVTGETTRYKEKDGKVSKSSKTLTAFGKTYDMLSIFYYLRTIDFTKFSDGQQLSINMFSGSKTEKLTIRSLGKEKVKLRNKTEKEACHVKFNFTTEGKKKSSDDIDAWISLDQNHIPLVLMGKLPVGSVRCYFTGF